MTATAIVRLRLSRSSFEQWEEGAESLAARFWRVMLIIICKVHSSPNKPAETYCNGKGESGKEGAQMNSPTDYGVFFSTVNKIL